MMLILIAALSFSPAWGMSKKPPTPPSQTAAEADTVWVGKSDNAKSCEKSSAIALDKIAAELQGKEVKVLAKKKVHDGKMRIQMCGADKGDLNGFLISKQDLEKAKAGGFTPVQPVGP